MSKIKKKEKSIKEIKLLINKMTKFYETNEQLNIKENEGDFYICSRLDYMSKDLKDRIDKERNKTNFKYRTFYRCIAFQNDFDRLEFLKKYLNKLMK